jgi:hypothetical protein
MLLGMFGGDQVVRDRWAFGAPVIWFGDQIGQEVILGFWCLIVLLRMIFGRCDGCVC